MKNEFEAIFFYTGNDYLIVNNLLLNNLTNIETLMEVVNKDYKGMIEEMKANPAARLGLKDKELAQDIFNRYKKRFQEKIDVEKTLNRAREDIKNLHKLFSPATQPMILHRNIKNKHIDDFENKTQYEYKAFSSCLKKPTDIIYSYGPKDKYIELIIEVPQNFPIIEIDNLPKFIQNEEGEIILPPFLANITKIEKVYNNKCDAKIYLQLNKSF